MQVVLGDDFAKPVSFGCCPIVIIESAYGDVSEAIAHYTTRKIVTRHPHEMTANGLLRYCELLVDGFSPIDGQQSNQHLTDRGSSPPATDSYLCSRFFLECRNMETKVDRVRDYMLQRLTGPRSTLRLPFLNWFCTLVHTKAECVGFAERQKTAVHICLSLRDLGLST